MRIKLAVLILFSLVLNGCKPSVPDGVLSPNEMEDLLYDYHLADAMAQYSYENIRHTLLTYKYIENGQECLKAFWDMFVVDFLIGGGGRNASNWGFIGHKGRLSPAPVFDSSSSFYYKDYSESGFAEPGDITPPRMTFG